MHDVFICHPSEDKPTADAVVATLEAHKIRCWIAPRDVVPGDDWARAIVTAIASSRIMILLFSENSNRSGHVMREVEQAVQRGIPILPFRTADVMPNPALEYFIGGTHWLDALTPPLEAHLDRLAGTVEILLARSTDVATDAAAQRSGAKTVPTVAEVAAAVEATGDTGAVPEPATPADAATDEEAAPGQEAVGVDEGGGEGPPPGSVPIQNVDVPSPPVTRPARATVAAASLDFTSLYGETEPKAPATTPVLVDDAVRERVTPSPPPPPPPPPPRQGATSRWGGWWADAGSRKAVLLTAGAAVVIAAVVGVIALGGNGDTEVLDTVITTSVTSTVPTTSIPASTTSTTRSVTTTINPPTTVTPTTTTTTTPTTTTAATTTTTRAPTTTAAPTTTTTTTRAPVAAVARDDSYTLTNRSQVCLDVTANDSGTAPLTVASVGSSQFGSARPADCGMLYSPPDGITRPDAYVDIISYTMRDGRGATSTASVRISVN